MSSTKEHGGVNETTAKDSSDHTPYPQPSHDPNNNSDEEEEKEEKEDDNNKNKDKKGDNDKDGKEPTKEKEGPFVDLGYAEYEGNVLDSDIHEYLGIRFAKAPSGDLRWRAPVKPDSMTKPQKAQEVCIYISPINTHSRSHLLCIVCSVLPRSQRWYQLTHRRRLSLCQCLDPSQRHI